MRVRIEIEVNMQRQGEQRLAFEALEDHVREFVVEAVARGEISSTPLQGSWIRVMREV